MNPALILIGVIKLGVSIVVGGFGVLLAYRLLARVLKLESILDNPAAGVLHASMLISLALLIRNSLGATFDTIDLLLRHNPGPGTLGKLAFHSVVHIGLGLVVASALLALSVWLFDRLTPGIDEIAAVREGKLGPALVLGAIVVSLALLTAPALDALLSGLVPFPSLPTGTGVSPS